MFKNSGLRNIGYIPSKQNNNDIRETTNNRFIPLKVPIIKNNIEVVNAPEIKGSGLSYASAMEQVSKINFGGSGMKILGLNPHSDARSSALYNESPMEKRGSGKLPGEELKRKLLAKMKKNKR